MANCFTALTPFVAKRYGARSEDKLFRTGFGEIRTIACSSGVHQEGPMGPGMFFLALRSGMKHARLFFAHMDAISLGYMGITAKHDQIYLLPPARAVKLMISAS